MSKLFCDCKTDEEKSNFFLSGQGVETGIIAPAISNEVAMAFHRCFEFEKQLAEAQEECNVLRKIHAENIAILTLETAQAIAACKLKDVALENVEGMLDELRYYPVTYDEIIEALAILPDDSALKAWLESYEYAELAEKRDAIPEGWVLVPKEILDRFPEINPSNYDHEDACNLNEWGIELVLASAPKGEVK